MRLFNYKFKYLQQFFKNKSGRNNSGKIVLRHRGSGKKFKYRLKNNYNNIYFQGLLVYMEQNRSQSATLGCFLYNIGFFVFSLTVLNIKIGCLVNPILSIAKNTDKFLINTKSNIFLNSSVLLRNINIGTFVSNLELKPGYGGQLVKTPNNFGQFLMSFKKFNKNYALIRLRNKREFLIHPACSCLIGIVNNFFFPYYNLFTKAGQKRNLNKRPVVRGCAMNPVDHPMGGNTAGGKLSRSFSNVLAKGYRTTKYKRKISVSIL